MCYLIAMRVLVCGGRDFSDYAAISIILEAIHAKRPITLLIQGGARGADSLAFEWAAHSLIPTKTFPAAWGIHGKSAGPIRNNKMLTDGKPDLVVAFPGGSGTAHMVKIAKDAGVEVREIRGS